MKTLLIIALSLFTFSHQAKSLDKNIWLKYYAYVDTADYYNAVLCADHIGKVKKATIYMAKLAEKGLDKKYFEDNPYLNNVKNSSAWKKFVSAYPDYHKNYLKDTIGIVLRKEFDAMNERDQYYVRKKYESPAYEDSVSFITYENIIKFISIVNRYGFPDENLLGITTLPYNSPYFLLLLHFQEGLGNLNHPKFSARKQMLLDKGMDYNKVDLIGILKKAVWEGKFHPNSIASLSLANNRYGNVIMLQVNDTLSAVDYSDSIKVKIDSVRKDIGLCNLEMHVKKSVYKLYKLDHFREKMKTETPKEYMEYLGSYSEKSKKRFFFWPCNLPSKYVFQKWRSST